MGTNSSKCNGEAVDKVNNDSEVGNNSDPRSPTPEITRTPLQNKPGSTHQITKNVDLRKVFENANDEENIAYNNPILSAVIKNHLLLYDPRSPTQDFDRTPIVISKTDDESNNKQRYQGDNCGSPILKTDFEDECCTEAYDRSPDLVVSRNLCEGIFSVTLDESLKESEEPLGSSTVSNEAIEEEIRDVKSQAVTLLETNFDYIETDDKFEDSEDNIQGIKETKKAINQIPLFRILNEDPRSPSIGIDRTPIVVAKTEDLSSEENVESMSDEALVKVLENANAELRHNIVGNSDNSDGLLIYEDETANINDTPKKSKTSSVNGSRTPLSCMKNKSDHTRSMSANTLYDDPKNKQNSVSKIPKRVSHIPRLKCLSKQTKLMPVVSSVSLKNISKTATSSGDCENTPPHSHRDIWDKDSSIVL